MNNYSYTVIQSTKPIGKTVGVDGLPAKGNQNLYEGVCQRQRGTLEEFVRAIEGLGNTGAITSGQPIGDSDTYQITTKNNEKPGATQNGVPVIARSKENFEFPDAPGFICADIDPGHWDGDPLDTIDKAKTALSAALGIKNLDSIDHVIKPSSSSFIKDTGTGKFTTELRGLHIYIGCRSLAPLADGGDSRLIEIGFANGMGSIQISKSGGMLKRGVFDKAPLQAPNNLIYAGSPSFNGPHERDCEITINHGKPLDLQSLYYRLDANAKLKAESAWATLTHSHKGEQTVVEERYIAATMKKHKIPREQVVKALHCNTLCGSFPITFNDGTTVPVYKLLTDPDKYHGRSDVRDPLEPDYGESKAKIWVEQDVVMIHSFAHGGRLFKCFLDEKSFTNYLAKKSPGPEEAVRLAARVSGCTARILAYAIKENSSDQLYISVLTDKIKLEKDKIERIFLKSEGWDKRFAFIATPKGRKFLDLEYLATYMLPRLVDEASLNGLLLSAFPGRVASNWLLENDCIPKYIELHSEPATKAGGAPPQYDKKLNTWCAGPTLGAYDPEIIDISVWLDHIEHLIPDERDRNDFIQWMAWNVQNPGTKGAWQYILYSPKEGVGKDLAIQPFRYALGTHNCTDVTTAQLKSDFNEFLLYGDGLVVLQELDIGDSKKYRDSMKPYAAPTSQTHIDINVKQQTIVKMYNAFALLVLTNHFKVIDMDGNDRRYQAIEIMADKMLRKDVDALLDFYSQGGLQAVANYLYSLDVSSFDAFNAPAPTDYKRALASACETNVAMTLRNLLEDPDSHLYGCNVVTPKDLLDRLPADQWAGMNLKNIGTTLRDMGWRDKSIRIDKTPVKILYHPSLRIGGEPTTDQLRTAYRKLPQTHVIPNFKAKVVGIL